MNANQLHSERLARWSQNGEARLTLESAAEWLSLIGLCLWLPTGPREAAPASSFLEAVVGRPAPVPSVGEKTRAGELLARMIENAAAAPLKFGSESGERPEWIAGPEALRYVYALRGDRNFKNGPSIAGKASVTPLALHCFEAIQEQGPLTVSALQTALGEEITEAALGRALDELWLGLYVFPICSGDPQQAARWESFPRRFPEPVAAGACTSHAEAQSALISLYLHSVVAATEEEILAFLGPLASQSKLREVIRDLGSMRQLEIVDIGGRAHLCLQGEQLPEMAVRAFQAPPSTTSFVAEENTAEENPAATHPATEPDRRRPFGKSDRVGPKKFTQRKFGTGDSRPPKFTSSRFDRRDSRKQDGAGASPKREFSGEFRGRGKPPAKSGGQAWARPGNKPWVKKETDGPPSERGAWHPRDRDDRGQRGGESRARPSYGRDQRGGGRWNPRPRRSDASDEGAGTPGSAQKRPWSGESSRPKSGEWKSDRSGPSRSKFSGVKPRGPGAFGDRRRTSNPAAPEERGGERPNQKRPKRFTEKGPTEKGDAHGNKPFWAGRPQRKRGAARKPGAKRTQGGPRGKKK